MSLKGKWEVVVHTYMGDQSSFHELDVEGNNVSGTVTDKGNGNTVDVVDGKFDDGKFSYGFTLKIPIGELDFTINGELVEDGKIKGQSVNAMGSFDFDGTLLV